jgi:hypothetical protein
MNDKFRRLCQHTRGHSPYLKLQVNTQSLYFVNMLLLIKTMGRGKNPFFVYYATTTVMDTGPNNNI